MKSSLRILSIVVLTSAALTTIVGSALAVTIDTVLVGNPGNAADTTGYGSVGYSYRMGKFEITSEQYTEFLNAVAVTDTYSLYNPDMWLQANSPHIQQTGSSGNYSYSVAADWADRPVSYVSLWDAVRFVNWLHNGQPTGSQNASTTEDGAYTLNGYTGSDGTSITRKPGAKFWIPSNDEWHKAAYYDAISGSYFLYPTASNATPSNVLSNPLPDPGNSANYNVAGVHTIGSPYWRTEVGDFENSASPYGTFDQGGNVSEWNEQIVIDQPSFDWRAYRGGTFGDLAFVLQKSLVLSDYPNNELYFVGFRVATVPEPSALALAALGMAFVVGRSARLRLRRRTSASSRKLIPVVTGAIAVTALPSWRNKLSGRRTRSSHASRSKQRYVAAILLFCALGLLWPASARAVTIDTVLVGNASNANDTTGLGGVGYEYRIGTYEVTNAQYVEFLNANATSDPLGLYSTNMGSNARGGITRSGVDGSYTYVVKTDMGNKPVNYVNWYDAIRFANWLHNGQGTSDTEDGAYTLLGGTPTPSNGTSITRNTGATWFLPSENEWYKAAYYQPAAQGGDSDDYWLYPTASNAAPTIASANSVGDISNPGANVANYSSGADWNSQNGNVTTVGSAGGLSASFYGTSDQGGNVWEWNQDPFVGGTWRGERGGAWINASGSLAASPSSYDVVTSEANVVGFRVATVPEPSALVLAAFGLAGMMVGSRLRSRRLSRAVSDHAPPSGTVARLCQNGVPLLLCCALSLLLPIPARAVTIETVLVGNPGNDGELSGAGAGGVGPNAIVGAVNYDYRIGTYEVTNAQYAEFLNAKAASNPLGLYNTSMGSDLRGGITQSGIDGSYTYALKPNMGDQPVNWVSWYDAIRFANWLHNSQGIGDTETGAYTLLGGTPTPSNGTSITRNVGAIWFLTSENEWYKAAYYDPISDGYFLYPTGSNSPPTAEPPPGGSNSANSLGAVGTVTDVGAYMDSASPYGTFDQGGNVWEFNEQPFADGSIRGMRGGVFGGSSDFLRASDRIEVNTLIEDYGLGFRVGTVPEPSMLVLAVLGLAGMSLASRVRKRRRSTNTRVRRESSDCKLRVGARSCREPHVSLKKG